MTQERHKGFADSSVPFLHSSPLYGFIFFFIHLKIWLLLYLWAARRTTLSWEKIFTLARINRLLLSGPPLCSLAGENRCWKWEQYKRNHTQCWKDMIRSSIWSCVPIFKVLGSWIERKTDRVSIDCISSRVANTAKNMIDFFLYLLEAINQGSNILLI